MNEVFLTLLILLIAILMAPILIFCWKDISKGMAKHFKDTADKRQDIWFMFHGIPRHIKMSEEFLNQSQYWNTFSKGNDHWEWRGTLDCKAMLELARILNDRLRGKSDEYKANYILALVQQNTKYYYDKDLYGKTDRFAFPVCTAFLHKGDCEDSSLLGACLSKLCGLDVAMFFVYRHMAYGVNLGTQSGKGLKFNDKWYQWCESTGLDPVGCGDSSRTVYDIFYLEYPPKDYIGRYTEQEAFEQYK